LPFSQSTKHSDSPLSGRRRTNGKPQPTRNNNSKRNDFPCLHVTRHRTLFREQIGNRPEAGSPMSKQPPARDRGTTQSQAARSARAQPPPWSVLRCAHTAHANQQCCSSSSFPGSKGKRAMRPVNQIRPRRRILPFPSGIRGQQGTTGTGYPISSPAGRRGCGVECTPERTALCRCPMRTRHRNPGAGAPPARRLSARSPSPRHTNGARLSQ